MAFLSNTSTATQAADSEIDHAYRDAEGWVLFDSYGEPVDWPKSWPDEIDPTFLRGQGIKIVA